MRYRTRSDNNQKEIDKVLRSVGASVVALSNATPGCPDRLVGFRGETFLLETKNKDTGRGMSRASRANHMRTTAQTEFHATWQGKPISVVYSPDEALIAIGASK